MAISNSEELEREFSERVEKLRIEEGLVAMGTTVRVGEDTNSDDLRAVDDNILEMRERGVKPVFDTGP